MCNISFRAKETKTDMYDERWGSANSSLSQIRRPSDELLSHRQTDRHDKKKFLTVRKHIIIMCHTFKGFKQKPTNAPNTSTPTHGTPTHPLHSARVCMNKKCVHFFARRNSRLLWK